MNQSAVEICPNIHRLHLAPNPHFEFNQFLIIDEKNVLIHTGKNSFFNSLKDMVLKKLDGAKLDYIIFSHFEADECGSINSWLKLYPDVQVVCNKITNINLSDFLEQKAIVLKDGQTLNIGKRTLQIIETPHFPHNWDAHLWYEKNDKVLFSSDFCCHGGISEPVSDQDNSQIIIDFYTKGNFIPYGPSTDDALEKLAQFDLQYIAPMHGSVLSPKCSKKVFDLVKNDLNARA